MKKFRLDGVVGVDFTAAYVAKQLEGAGDVEVTLNTPGGDVSEGMAIYQAIADHGGKTSVVIDRAFSMGSIIILAFDDRVARKESSMLMIHRPWGMGAGDADDMRASAEVLDKMQAQMMGIYMAKVSVSESKLESMLDAETYLDAEEALAAGLVDRVISGSKNALHQMAFAALADGSDLFSRVKFAAKVRQIEAKGGDFCASLQKSDKLSDIESAIRQRFGASRTEATAIVSSVKRVQGDLVGGSAEDSAGKALEFIKNFKL